MKTYILEIEPMGKPRMTQRDKWAGRSCVKNYFSYKDIIRWELKRLQIKEIPLEFSIIFNFTVPKSKNKKLIGTPHMVKPDIDNCLKAFLDAVFDKDQVVWHVDVKKLYAEKASIEITF